MFKELKKTIVKEEKNDRKIINIKNERRARYQWLMLIIIAAQEAEIRRTAV
jgi:biopolymer transport protein ExbD